VTFYVHEHNHVVPHSAFCEQTPDEMYFGTAEAVPEALTSRAAAARRARMEANRSALCTTCRPSAPHDRPAANCCPDRTLVRLDGDPQGEADARGPSKLRADPCPGSDSPFIDHISFLEWRELAR
jgi:hypothetical protein